MAFSAYILLFTFRLEPILTDSVGLDDVVPKVADPVIYRLLFPLILPFVTSIDSDGVVVPSPNLCIIATLLSKRALPFFTSNAEDRGFEPLPTPSCPNMRKLLVSILNVGLVFPETPKCISWLDCDVLKHISPFVDVENDAPSLLATSTNKLGKLLIALLYCTIFFIVNTPAIICYPVIVKKIEIYLRK